MRILHCGLHNPCGKSAMLFYTVLDARRKDQSDNSWNTDVTVEFAVGFLVNGAVTPLILQVSVLVNTIGLSRYLMRE